MYWGSIYFNWMIKYDTARSRARKCPRVDVKIYFLHISPRQLSHDPSGNFWHLNYHFVRYFRIAYCMVKSRY